MKNQLVSSIGVVMHFMSFQFKGNKFRFYRKLKSKSNFHINFRFNFKYFTSVFKSDSFIDFLPPCALVLSYFTLPGQTLYNKSYIIYPSPLISFDIS